MLARQDFIQDPVSLMPVRLKCHNELEKFISQSLLANWTIYIEYLERDNKPQWQVWEKPLFAINNPSEVLSAIYDCCAQYPNAPIRIYAQQLRPETRLVYRIDTRMEVDSAVQQHSGRVISAENTDSSWNEALVARIRSGGKTFWGSVAVAGAVTGSILMLE